MEAIYPSVDESLANLNEVTGSHLNLLSCRHTSVLMFGFTKNDIYATESAVLRSAQ